GPRLMTNNADEGEPGTFKDRHYLESDPHRFLEGAPIGAWAVACERYYIYLLNEYPAVSDILLEQIAKLAAAGLPKHCLLELRRRLRLRRGVCHARVDRGQARPAASPATLHRRDWPVRPADTEPERRDHVLGARHRREGRRVVHLARPQRRQGPALLLGFGPC